MDDRRIVQSLKRKAKPEARLLPSSDEMRLLVEKSKAETIDAASFESAILGLIDGHIKKGHEGRYVNESSTIVDKGRPTRGWMSPYRRVQFVAWYMRWLKDGLKTMPDDRELRKWFEDLEQLAKDIRIGGKIKIDDSLSIEERVLSLLRQTKNPYFYRYNGVVVKMSFAEKQTLEDCISNCMYTA